MQRIAVPVPRKTESKPALHCQVLEGRKKLRCVLVMKTGRARSFRTLLSRRNETERSWSTTSCRNRFGGEEIGRLNYGAYFTVSYSIVLYTTIEYDWYWKNIDLGEDDALLWTPSSSLVGYGLKWVGWDVRFVPLSFSLHNVDRNDTWCRQCFAHSSFARNCPQVSYWKGSESTWTMMYNNWS